MVVYCGDIPVALCIINDDSMSLTRSVLLFPGLTTCQLRLQIVCVLLALIREVGLRSLCVKTYLSDILNTTL